MNTYQISERELCKLLALHEDHFNDVKSKMIAPAKLQESFVAFANSDGGDLYIGIEDESSVGERINGFKNKEEANEQIATALELTKPAVENVIVEFLETESCGFILHFSIPKSPKVHFTAADECFIRVNASKRKVKGERVAQLAYAKGAEAYEKKIVENVDIEDILQSPVLSDYMTRVSTTIEPKLFLKKQQLLTRVDSERYPNVGCVLLFDEDAQATMSTRCAVKVYRLRTIEREYKREQLQQMPVTINGTIESVINDTIEKVKEYINGASFTDGDQLIKLLYPAEALKEILVNAVIHRDYSLNDDIHVRIFDNRIEVQSPGKLPGYMTLANLYTERFSRNPNIVRMLHNLPNPVNHDIGEGLDTAKNELKRAGLIDPSFEETENAFIVTIKHQRIASIEDVIINYFDENPGSSLTNKLVRQLSGEDDMQKVKLALQKLRALGKINVENEKASAFNYRYIKA